MSDPAANQEPEPEGSPSPQVLADLLEVVAEHSVDHALSNIEQLVAKLRADARQVDAARGVIRDAPAELLRQGVRLRAARVDTAR